MITDFLFDKSLTTDDLQAALRVLRRFKKHESFEEWMGIRFDAWAKLEQLEEFLDFLVGDGELEEDTQRNIVAGRTPRRRKQ